MAPLHGLSHQLFFDIQMMVMGFVGLLSYLELRHGTVAVSARKCNQDSLESLFGHLRWLCGGGCDPNIFKAVHALPTVQAQRDIKKATARWRSMNSSRKRTAGPVPASSGSSWLEGRRILLPSDFVELCQAARVAKAEGHPVFWQTLRELVKSDEAKCQSVRGGHRMLPWLKMSTHVNKTGFSRMRVGLALDVVSIKTARAMQIERLGLVAF